MNLRTATWMAMVTLVALAGCARPEPEPHPGRALYTYYGCHTCHRLGLIDEARGNVGPPLDDLGTRTYAGGRLNDVEALAEFIHDPRAVDPRTPMPDVGVTEEDARVIAAFLHTLR